MPSVKDLMKKDVITIEQHMTVSAAAILMSESSIGCLVVVDNKAPVGIVTERDFVRRVIAKNLSPLSTKISEIMSKPLTTVDPDLSVRDAARIMIKKKIRRLPVVKENQLLGILVVSDFARQLSKKTLTEEVLEAMARYPLEVTPY
ncbi:MAG: cyclic nucleotide-binding/CBS domain-containing protein [Candidatus Hermodarchaeota archaeon]